jgi:negative regulator of flagellin synthesis FlgM
MKVGNKFGSQMPNVDGTKTNKLNDRGSTSNSSSIKKNNLEGTAKLNLSERAQSMQKAKDIASDSSVDEARIAQLQKLIDSGNYSVDADAIADRLVDEHLLMGE